MQVLHMYVYVWAGFVKFVSGEPVVLDYVPSLFLEIFKVAWKQWKCVHLD
jgi:hypothetical protein